MLALIFDVVGSYFLSQKVSRWLFLIPLAVLLGVVASFAANIGLYYVMPDMFPAHEAAMRAIFGAALHPFFCILCVWWFRRKRLQAQVGGKASA